MVEKVELVPSVDLVKQVRDETENLILYFSCGKDSVAMWLWLRQFDFNIMPVYLYTIPGLRSDDENLTYYEKYFGTHILRFPHPLLYQMLNDNVYQSPERVALIESWRIPNFKFADIDYAISSSYGLDPCYAAMGMRMADNLDRRMMMYQNGALGTKNRRFYYAIWDWNVRQVSEIINANKVKLPKAYRFMGRTVAAIDYYYMKPFKKAYPDDYQKYLEWFPLLDAEFYRYERLGRGKEKRTG